MKKMILVGMILSLCTLTSMAQSNYKEQNVSADGVIHDKSGKKIGHVEPATGKVVNHKGETLGTIEKDGTLKDSEGQVLGHFQKDTFTDSKGTVLGTVDDNGVVKDYKGHILGKVHPSQKQYGAVYYYYIIEEVAVPVPAK